MAIPESMAPASPSPRKRESSGPGASFRHRTATPESTGLDCRGRELVLSLNGERQSMAASTSIACQTAKPIDNFVGNVLRLNTERAKDPGLLEVIQIGL